MFKHTKMLQHPAKPDRPDPLFAKKNARNFRRAIRRNFSCHAVLISRLEHKRK